MKLNYDIHGTTLLRITDEKYHPQLFMDYDDQLEQYQLAIRVGVEGEVEPLNPIRRREGETDETYFDRATSLATRIYLNKLHEMIEENSRYERMQPILDKIRNKLYHMIGVIDHWDNTTPTEAELGQLDEVLHEVTNWDARLSEVS